MRLFTASFARRLPSHATSICLRGFVSRPAGKCAVAVSVWLMSSQQITPMCSKNSVCTRCC